MMPRSIDARSQTAANEQLEKAVYSHLQAVRALGRVTANTADIARALGVTTIAVDNTLAALAKKGVKITE
jgi:Mn-dependent DtxR family transcriptional regulator